MVTSNPFGDSAPVHSLSDGYVIPSIALGVWQVPSGRPCFDAVSGRSSSDIATSTRHRRMETKAVWERPSHRVGSLGIRCSSPLSSCPAGVTTWPERLKASLERLGVDHVDLYLVHWPQGGATLGVARDGAGPGGRVHTFDRGVELQCPRELDDADVGRQLETCRQSDPAQPVQRQAGTRRARSPPGARHGGVQPTRHRTPSRRFRGEETADGSASHRRRS